MNVRLIAHTQMPWDFFKTLPGVNGNKWEDVNNLIAALENVI